MSKKAGTKTRNIYHRKDQAGEKNDKRVTCKLCDTPAHMGLCNGYRSLHDGLRDIGKYTTGLY